MRKPQVTITLGRSGQKVVKESRRYSDGGFGNDTVTSGGKRSFTESSGSNGDRSLRYNKRLREDVSVRGYWYGSHMVMDESRISPKDLRLKLLRKRTSRGVGHKNDKQENMKLHEKELRTVRSLESSGQGASRNSRGTASTLQCDSARDYYASWYSNAVRSRSSDQLIKSTGGFFVDELPRFASTRRGDTSRTSNMFTRDQLNSSRPKVHMPTASRHPLSVSPHLDSQPLTVSSLLHSLGLAKYSINFQVEEIDMDALKQMGDYDLKELGIPMGPRKKILLSLQAPTNHATIQAQAHNFYRP